MKHLLRPGLLVGVLAAVLLALTGVAAFSLWRLGSDLLAVLVAVAGVAAVLVVGAAWALAGEAEQQWSQLLPPLPPEPPPVLAQPRRAFRVREARPGEVPEPYLAAVRRGAQARQAAWKASAGEQ